METKKIHIFNLLSFYTLLGTFFVSLFFFIPFVPVSIDVAKGFLISTGVTLSVFFWLMARLIDGKFTLPKDRMVLVAAFIPITFLVSAFFSSSIYLSLFGHGFEVGTFGTMLILFLVLLLSSIYFQTEKNIKMFFGFIIIGSFILALTQITQFFGLFNKIAPNIFSGVTGGNLLGTWSNFSSLFGGIIVLIISILEFVKIKQIYKILLSIFGFISLFLLMLLNTYFVWILVGVFALLIFVYSISQNRTNDRTLKNFPYLSFVVVLISLLFLVGNTSASSIVAQYFGTITPEIYPSISGTMNMVAPSLKHNVLFGTGPNTFALDWSLWKPMQVMQSMFWGIDFQSGFGMIPTFLITTGILGFASWLLLFIIFILRAIQSLSLIFRRPEASRYIAISLLLALYFWISAFISNPNFTLLVMLFASTGVFIGTLVNLNLLPVHEKSYLDDPRTSFFSIFGLVLLMILSVSTCYIYAEKFTGVVYVSTSSPKDNSLIELSRSESKILKGIALDKNDIYYSNLSQIYLAEIQTILADKTLSADTVKSVTQDKITNIESAVASSIKQNPKYYLNWKNAGDIYAVLLSIGVKGTYENSASSYEQASKLSPNNPGILLARAQLEIVNKDTEKAKSYIEEALKIKSDYIDAIFMRAQIKFDAGDVSGAIGDAELAAAAAPRDASVYFKLGGLKYNNNDNTGAISAFEMALTIDPNYHNARYLLGLAYRKAGRADESHKQFELLHTLFPENIDVTNAFNGKIENTPTPVLNTKDKKDNILPKKA